MQEVKTNIGNIACHIQEVAGTTPLVFLHGVYLDHHVWDKQLKQIKDQSTIAIDMPLHGDSKNGMRHDWSLNDCAQMLIEILDALNYKKAIAIGHSWGSMVVLRAAHQAPERFQSVGFCNLPIHEVPRSMKMMFGIQHRLLSFRNFYSKQVAKAIFGKASLKNNPAFLDYVKGTMAKLSNQDFKTTDRAVILKSKDATNLVEELKVPAMSLKGKEDYVPELPGIEMQYVEGGHSSPMEDPEAVLNFVNKVKSLE